MIAKKGYNKYTLKPKELKIWDFLIKTLAPLKDNNFTARKIYDKIESLSPILFK